jgi:hypothetical protein
VTRKFPGERAGSTERHQVWDCFSSRTASLFLTAADDERRKFYSVANVERADAFRRVELVARNREEINRPVLSVERNLPDGLDAIHVKDRV